MMTLDMFWKEVNGSSYTMVRTLLVKIRWSLKPSLNKACHQSIKSSYCIHNEPTQRHS
jgi:hypothetical protein